MGSPYAGRRTSRPSKLQQQQSAAQAELAAAQAGADNNIAIAKELERRGNGDVGLLKRAIEADRIARNTIPNTTANMRAMLEKKRVLQDAGYNTSLLGQQASTEQRAKVRPRRIRAKRGSY